MHLQLFSHLPEVSLECSSNVLQMHTCVDSCIALRDLLVYLASDGDLRPLSSEARERGTTTPPNSSLVPSSYPPSSSPPSQDIGDLMSEAMDDTPQTTPTHTPTVRNDGGSQRSSRVDRDTFHVQKEKTSKIKMQVY